MILFSKIEKGNTKSFDLKIKEFKIKGSAVIINNELVRVTFRVQEKKDSYLNAQFNSYHISKRANQITTDDIVNACISNFAELFI